MKDQIIVVLSDYASSSRYKAEVRVVSPVTAKSELPLYDHCFVGVSLDNPNFLGGKLQSIIDYVSTHFKQCSFLLGDHVHRLTLQIRKNLNAEQCFYHALGLGDYYLRTQGHMFRNTQTDEKFPIIRGSDIYFFAEVRHYLACLQQQFIECEKFRQSVMGFAQQFIARGDEFNENTEELTRLSCQYVLEELAETCYMISLGHPVLVYPGSLTVFQEISDGLFAGLPEELNQLINVGLRLKRKGSQVAKIVQPSESYVY